MFWFKDMEFLAEQATHDRQKWDESAPTEVGKILPKLPPELRDKSRLATLFIYTQGGEGMECTASPLDGSVLYGIALEPNDEVKLIDTSGQIFFEGLWKDTTKEMIQSHSRFYIWLENV